MASKAARAIAVGFAGFSAGTALALSAAVLSRTRPARYPMCLPVLYKADDESRWHEGITVSLSASGALIEGEMPASHVESIVVVIPLLSSDGCLTGRGRVVRTPDLDAVRGPFAIAVPHYRLQHQAIALAQLDTLHQGC